LSPYEELPDDDVLAFLHLEAEFREEFNNDSRSEDANWLFSGNQYLNKTLAAADELGIEELLSFDNGSAYGDKNFSEHLQAFQRAVEKNRCAHAHSTVSAHARD